MDSARAAEEQASSWTPVDIGAVLRGELVDQPPTILDRGDGNCLLYPGRVHAVNSESEAGKTWLALAACAEQMLSGWQVAYLDFEDSAQGVVGRLVEMGVPPAVLEEMFVYVRPSEPLDESGRECLQKVTDDYGPLLTIIDGVTEAMVLHDFSISDNNDVGRFMKLLPRPIADTTSAVLLLDHVVKNPKNRGRFAIGGQHKTAAIDGAVYSLTNEQPFGRGGHGTSDLTVTKDRPGYVRGFAPNGSVARLHVVSMDGRVDVHLEPLDAADVRPAAPDLGFAERASRLLERGELNLTAVRVDLGGKHQRVDETLRWLEVGGFVASRAGKGREILWRSVNAFRADDAGEAQR